MNLGVLFDSSLTVDPYEQKVVKSYFLTSRYRKIASSLSAAEKLINIFV